MKIVITRSKWLRGSGSYASFLVRYSDGKMCCLGFLGVACGISAADMEGKAAPNHIKDHFLKWPKGTLRENGMPHINNGFDNGPAIQAAIKHNDDPLLTDDNREELIRNNLKELGIEVEFED